MKKTNSPFHVGDNVRIIEPCFVLRVGYPKTPADYLPAVEDAHAELALFLKSLGINPVAKAHNQSMHTLKKTLAYMLAQKDHFGGLTRSLHYNIIPGAVNATTIIQELKTVVTGHYSPGSHGSHDNSFDDGEPASLDNRTYHRLAKVTPPLHGLNSFYEMERWIEVDFLEKVPLVLQDQRSA